MMGRLRRLWLSIFAGLGARVTLAILAVAIPALAVMGGMTYRQAYRAGMGQLDATLAAHGRSVTALMMRTWLREQWNRGTDRDDRDQLPGDEAGRFPALLFRVSSGEVIFQQGDLTAEQMVIALQDPPLPGDVDGIRFPDGTFMRRVLVELFHNSRAGGGRPPPEFRLPASRRLALSSQELGDLAAVVLTDTALHDAALAQLRLRIISLTLLTIAACVVAGALAGGAIARPLRLLGERMKNLDSQRLEEPLDVGAPVREVRELIHAIDAARAGLAQAFAREQRLTADIAHELRSPLAVLQAELASLPEIPRPAQEAGRQLQFIIDALLTLSRIEAGNAKARPQMVDVMDLVDTAWRGLDAAAQDRGMQVTRTLDPTLELSTDPVHAGMALRNLFDNAVSHGDAGGMIHLSAEVYKQGVRLSVRNTCEGAMPELVDKMFDPCWRNGSTSAGVSHLHAGLGCTLIARLAGLLGGSVQATLDNDELSVCLYLPNISASGRKP